MNTTSLKGILAVLILCSISVHWATRLSQELSQQHSSVSLFSQKLPQHLTSSIVQTHSSTKEQFPRCLSFETDIATLVAASKQIFITTPAKTAGTSIKTFTRQCMNSNVPYESGKLISNINLRKEKRQALMNVLEPPKVIASHVWVENAMINLVQQVTSDTLLIYSYRSETDRQLATIRAIVESSLCGRAYQQLSGASFGDPKRDLDEIWRKNGTACILDEAPLLEFLSERRGEMNCGIFQTLTCNVYDAIEQNAPNLVFVNYKQSKKLQQAIAMKHCPDLANKEVTMYAAKDRKQEVFISLNNTLWNGKKEVPLEIWLQAKWEMMEWSLDLKKDASCQARTRKLEAALLTCPDEAAHIAPFYFSDLLQKFG